MPSVKEIFDEAGGKNIKRKGKEPLYNKILKILHSSRSDSTVLSNCLDIFMNILIQLGKH